MLRRSNILTAAALALCCALAPAAAADPFTDAERKLVDEYKDLGSVDGAGPSQDLRSPDAQDAAAHRGLYEADPGPYVLARDYGSPDAADAARDLPPATATASPAHFHPGPFTDSERRLVGSPEVQGMVDRVSREIRTTPAVVEVQAPSGFDWGDAGIGAAGMLALFSIATGSVLLIAGRRRRQGVRVATH
jgi:hypothetical protein